MQGLVEFFNPLAVPARGPNTLRTACSNKSDLSPYKEHACAILQQDAATPGTLGSISILNGVKVFLTCIGVPWTSLCLCP